MIFVTVGTHEQQFNRLIQYMDKLKADDIIQEEVIIQTGFSTYKPQYCKWEKIIPYKEMIKNVTEARIVITHGGPASFIMSLQIGKVPVVVPRRHSFGEHVNDHQVDFVKAVSEKMGTIIPVFEIDNLKEVITSYDNIISSMPLGISNNNEEFNRQFEKIVEKMF